MARRPPKEVRAEAEMILRQSTVNGWDVKCRDNPGPYQDFVVKPTKDEAWELCDGCPFMLMCRERAVADRGWGVWGGLLYQEGRRIPFRVIGRPALEEPDAA